MPLIIVVGGPSSGKTRRATELAEHFTKVHSKNVVLINEEALKLNKAECYKDVTSEKMLRLSIKSAVDKSLAGSTIVIADSQNYIKGFRYELFCLARALQTTVMTLYCNTPPEVAKKWNALQTEARFPPELMDDYYGRMEMPNPHNRWDQPLFVVSPGDALWLEKIDEAVLHGQKPKNPISTKKEVIVDADYMYELDKTCQTACASILEMQANYAVGDSFTIPGSTKLFKLVKVVSAIELKKARQEFLKIMKQQPSKPTSIADTFVDFLNLVLERDV